MLLASTYSRGIHGEHRSESSGFHRISSRIAVSVRGITTRTTSCRRHVSSSPSCVAFKTCACAAMNASSQSSGTSADVESCLRGIVRVRAAFIEIANSLSGHRSKTPAPVAMRASESMCAFFEASTIRPRIRALPCHDFLSPQCAMSSASSDANVAVRRLGGCAR